MPNEFQTIQSGQGLLKQNYPDSSHESDVEKALKNRVKSLRNKTKAADNDPVLDQNNEE